MIGAHLALELGRQHGAGEFIAERFRPDLGEQLVGGQFGGLAIIEEAEAAGVVEADGGAVLGLEHDMVVRFQLQVRRRPDHHAARHAQMRDQHAAVVQHHQDVFGAPLDSW